MNEREVKAKFWEVARRQYPDVGEPGVVWVLTEVLGWDWDKVSTVLVGGFSKGSYRIRVPKYGVVVTRAWTKAEKSKLRDWWWLLDQ